MNRRKMLTALVGALPAARSWAAGVSPDLKITRVETVYWKSRDEVPWWPHWTWVRIDTNQGVFGLGETYPRGETEAALVHSAAARALLGKHPGDIERIWKDLYVTFDFQVTGGAEMRVLSAINLALWDLLGKALQTPVYRLIGGKSNPRVRLYNTCFPYKYDFLREPEKIMAEVMEQRGIRAIKIWPFDGAARRHGGQFITPAEISEALTPVRKLRDAFGDKIEILIEFHSLWNLTSAIRIAHALEPYHPMWLEDMLLPGNFAQYRRLAESTPLGLTVGERMAGKLQFQSLLESRAPRYVMFDVCWCGGLTEARKITAMADAFELPFAPHTAGGPLLFYASTHLSTAMTNCWIQESCQRFYEHDWPAMLVNPLMPKDGSIEAPGEPGFGMTVKPEVWSDKRAIRRVTAL
ncbi:MAG: mandelate racemase/muconate lactonizing enzyme family protein [Bryobacterales bacterium]|nr:mandelate racemase/muconate lactonizing enzyme family protein [Bryobacterales bacterium]